MQHQVRGLSSVALNGHRARHTASTRPQLTLDDNRRNVLLTKHISSASAFVVAAAVLCRSPDALADVLRGQASPPEPCPTSQVLQPHTNPLSDLAAGLFGGGREAQDERDPITPFTLYGTNFKKYLIEELQGEKIISRKKGFTVNACVGAVEVSQETPQFQGLPTGDKALYAKDRVCRKSEGQDLKETCKVACDSACNESLDLHAQQVTAESGFRLLDADKARMAKSCARNCTYECVKPGKAFDFVIPYRR